MIAAHGYASNEVDTLLTDALDHGAAMAAPDDLFRLKRALWNCRQDQARLGESLQIAEDLEAQALKAERGDWRRLAHRARASNLLYQGDLRQAATQFQNGLDVDQPWSREVTLLEHGEDPEIFSRVYLGWIAAVDGRMDDARRDIAAGLAASKTLALPIITAFVGCIDVSAHYLNQDAVMAAERADAYIALCDQHDFPFWRASFEIMRGWAGVRNGEGRPALDRAARGLADWKATGALLHICTWNGVLGRAALSFGDLDLAEAAVREGLAASQNSGDRFLLTDVLLVQAELAQRRGDVTTAIQVAEECLGLADHQGVRRMKMRALRLLADVHTDAEARVNAQTQADQIVAALMPDRTGPKPEV